MKSIFRDKCSLEQKYKKYKKSTEGGITYIVPDTGSGKIEYCPFDDALSMVLSYLSIGYYHNLGQDTEAMVYDFVRTYGSMSRTEDRTNVLDFAEDAQMLYLHFSEATSVSGGEPEFILETDPVSAVLRVTDDAKYTEWQTESLSSAIELAYALLLCNNEKVIDTCKYCKMPFYAKNPKTEFCSPSCRNKYNVYKSRSKKR